MNKPTINTKNEASIAFKRNEDLFEEPVEGLGGAGGETKDGLTVLVPPVEGVVDELELL